MRLVRPVLRRAYNAVRYPGSTIAGLRGSWLVVRGRVLRNSVVDATSHVDVSMTSHGLRLSYVHIAIESIGRGSRLPRRLILWLNDAAMVDDPPKALVRLMRRGLELKLSPNYGPHTKYFPYVLETPDGSGPFVLADDDSVYGRSWLAALLNAAEETPEFVVCHRARRIGLVEGGLAPYATWKDVSDTEPSPLNLALAGEGVLYPCLMRRKIREAGRSFEAVAPKADDLWLHGLCLQEGVLVRQISARSTRHWSLPGTQAIALSNSNVLQGANDEQAARIYVGDKLARLLVERP